MAALERASLEEAEQRASTLARELQRVSSLLAADLEPRTVLRQIVAQASDLLSADACTLRLLEGGELVARAVLGDASDLLSGRRSLASDPVAAETLAGPAPVAIADLAADPRLAEDPVVQEAGLGAYLGVPVQTADGEIQGVLAVYTRMARRFRADEVDGLAALAGSAAVALRNAMLYERVAQEKDAGEAILAQVADAIVASDADDRITRWNAAAERVTGLRARRVLGRELGELLRSELGDSDGIARDALAAAAGGTGTSAPMEIRLERGGREIWLSATAASLRDPREELPGTVYAIRDVSDERRLDQVKSDFVATVSHELRTPLTSIYGFAETLLRADATFGEDDRATFVRYIATEAERLTRLVDGLLSATRLEAGAVQLALGPVDVPALAREVATAARGRSDKHQVKLVVPAHPVYALADQDRVRQVLINLVDNAIKYSPQGGEVRVQASGRGNLVEIRVSDQGMGISELDQQNLFRKFFRVDASQRGGIRGVGLGLFLVRGFVAAMGGRIWVESELGKGSTFVVELPATEEAPSAAASSERVA
jgi:PAS domain S-box-containing protein